MHVERERAVASSFIQDDVPSTPVVSRRRDLQFSLCDNFFSSMMLGAGETFLPAFALAIGASAVTAGLVGGVSVLIGATLQLTAPMLIRHVGCYRKWVAGFACLQALSFIPFAIVAYRGALISTELLFLLAALYWFANFSGASAWQSWMAQLVPNRIRCRYFAKRNHFGQLGLLCGILGAGALLEFAKRNGWELKAFACVFGFSTIARLTSSLCQSRQTAFPVTAASEPVPDQARHEKTRATWRVFACLLFIAIAINVSGPFYNCYMLKQLHVSYGQFMWLTASLYIAKILTLKILSGRKRERDSLRLMQMGLAGVAVVPLGWLLSTNVVYLLIVQFLSGVFWATYELGLLLVLFRTVKDSQRMKFFTIYNFASSLMIFIGSSIGASILDRYGETFTGYSTMFAVSLFARVAGLVLFTKIVVRDKARRLAPAAPVALAPSNVLAFRRRRSERDDAIRTDFR